MVIGLIKNETITNTIYVEPLNLSSFGAEGTDWAATESLGICVGDYRENGTWYRDVDGIKTALPLPDPKDEQIADMQAALQTLGVEQS